jgi:hypothetical protein
MKLMGIEESRKQVRGRERLAATVNEQERKRTKKNRGKAISI